MFVDQDDIAKTGLNSVNDVLQRLPSSGGGLNGKFNNSGNLGNPPDGGGVGAGSAEIDLRYLGSRRVLVLVDGIRYVNGASASRRSRVDRPQLHSGQRDRADRSAAGRRFGDLRLRRHRRRGQHHHQEAPEGLRCHGPARRLSRKATASPRITSSAGAMATTVRFEVVVGGNYVKQDSVSSGDRAISRFPGALFDDLRRRRLLGLPADGPLHRSQIRRFLPISAARTDTCDRSFRDRPFLDLTLNGRCLAGPGVRPVGPDCPATDFHAFGTADRFNFAPFNYLQIPLERLRRLRQRQV